MTVIHTNFVQQTYYSMNLQSMIVIYTNFVRQSYYIVKLQCMPEEISILQEKRGIFLLYVQLSFFTCITGHWSFANRNILT